jgi:Tfp pilus assembly protein PilF
LLRTSQDESKKVITDAEAGVTLKPNSADAHLRLGVAYASAGNLDAAGSELRRTLAIDPANGLAHMAMARLNYLRGQYSVANSELEMAVSAGHNAPLDFVNALKRKLARQD